MWQSLPQDGRRVLEKCDSRRSLTSAVSRRSRRSGRVKCTASSPSSPRRPVARRAVSALKSRAMCA